MKKILIYCVIAFSFWSCKSEIHTGATPKRGFYSDRPAKIWEESLVSGNGIMGAMVIGDPYQESFALFAYSFCKETGRSGKIFR